MEASATTEGEIKLEKVSAEVLIEHKADLDKLRTSHDYSNIAKLLKRLQRTQMTKELLVQTLIGKTMTTLSELQTPPEHGDKESEVKEVREMSSQLINKWKELLKQKSSTGNPSSSAPKLAREESKIDKSETQSIASNNLRTHST